VSQPTPYAPAHSFVSDASTLANFPGQSLDIEFQNVKTTTDQIRTNLALVQPDDGALANSSVTFDQLSPTLQTNGLATASAWLTAINYSAGTTVYQNFNLYRCLVAHTSGVFATDLAAAKWLLLVALPAGPTGPSGTASIGTTATLAAGAAATVTNTGTPQAGGFQFRHPTGCYWKHRTSGMERAGSVGDFDSLRRRSARECGDVWRRDLCVFGVPYVGNLRD
jgi:hypothetical protein